MFAVIGSGPAGVACAHALLAGGAAVTMLDAGLELEPDRRARVAALGSRTVSQWGPGATAFIREGVGVGSDGIPLKLAYGSTFPYRSPGPPAMHRDGAEGGPSFARGGLSNVWGASVMPFRAEELDGWPITSADLEPHYKAVLRLMPFAARHDRLEDDFPLFHDDPGSLRPSSQAAALLADLEHAHSRLLAHGVRFGASRLAVQASGARHGCVYCGLCMYGCPYEYIYNSAGTLDALMANPAFTYRPGVVVERVAERGEEVEIAARSVDDWTRVTVRADRAFLACGVFSTASIVLASLGAYEKRVRAADNCYFLLPLLRYRNQKDAAHEPLHTLAQVFVEVLDAELGPHVAHLQVYTYNELIQRQLQQMLGPLASVLGRVADRILLGRTLVIQGYLHSDLSPGIDLSLRRDGSLDVAVAANARTEKALAILKRKLWAERGSMRAIPLSPALRVGKPGRGFHTGGTFPMRAQPGSLETDVLGRPHGLSRVHVVDASVFPTLPATTITLSVMANSHRIGAAAVA